MTTYDELLNQLKQSMLRAKKVIPEMCYSLREEDLTLTNDEIKNRIKRDLISLGFSADYVGQCIPKEFKDPVKVESGSKGGQTTKLALELNDNVTINRAAFKAANPYGLKTVAEEQSDLVKMAAHLQIVQSRLEESKRENDQLRINVKDLGKGKAIHELKEKLEGAEIELQYLKEKTSNVVKVDPRLYTKIKNVVMLAIRDKIPYIRIICEGNEAKDFVTL